MLDIDSFIVSLAFNDFVTFEGIGDLIQNGTQNHTKWRDALRVNGNMIHDGQQNNEFDLNN